LKHNLERTANTIQRKVLRRRTLSKDEPLFARRCQNLGVLEQKLDFQGLG
jgi:hypothetical protein